MTVSAIRDHDQLTINTLRFLAVDMVQAANSGHPGAPMGQAAVAYRLWSRQLRFDPRAPEWPNRDRFVLSCGHASALLYGLLHLAGYEDMTLDELRNFRQLHSRTAGHPEYGHAAGIETTTGPLGQGVATAVGMAMAERMLGARFNRDGFALFDHRIWALASDGDLMEGVSAEAASMAGHLGLGKLNVLWDDNRITIDGGTEMSFTEDVLARHAAYGWHTLEVEDGNDLPAIDSALAAAAAETARPTLIRVRTRIGFGSPNKQDSSAAHGAPLGEEEVRLTKDNLGWPHEPTFHVPSEARQTLAAAAARGATERQEWDNSLERYATAHPEAAAELRCRLAGQFPIDWQEAVPSFEPGGQPLATRRASGTVLNAIAQRLPELIGGSADLAGSNKTMLTGREDHTAANPAGYNLYFGVREHAMGAAMNGMALSRLLRPYGGTFLIFSDYMRPAMRLAALMGLPTIYVMTHDSVFLGEDGPTHQPVSQLLSLRSIPNLRLFRPADANETAECWRQAILHQGGPSVLALTRQGLPILQGIADGAREGVARGAYTIADPADGEPQILLLATGSEVWLAVEAHQRLAAEGIATRVVSMPCWSLFDAQDAAYRDSVLPPTVDERLAVEAGSPMGWHKYVGLQGEVIAQEGFGASAPGAAIAEEFGYTVDNVVARAKALL